jgi:hypothetical protein
MYLQKLISKTTILKNCFSCCLKGRKDQDPESDPLVRGTDPQIRIRTKMSRLRDTSYSYSEV